MFKKALKYKEGYIPSFFMSIALVLLLLLSISIHNYLIWFSALFILLFFIAFNVEDKININHLTVLMFSFSVLLITNILYISPVKNVESIYLIVLFLSGYIFSLCMNKELLKYFLYITVIIITCLSLWGIYQYLSGQGYLVYVGTRANAIFYTPNTFAASINFILLPIIVLYIHKRLPNNTIWLTSVLFSGLLVSQSRGGWIAFILSFIFILCLLKYTGSLFSKDRVLKIVLSFFLLFLTYSIMNSVNIKSDKLDIELNNVVRSESIAPTMSHRIMFYDIAWEEIKKKYISGTGFHTFQYYHVKNQKPPYIGNKTRYVHNDYLQLWMETGIFGLICFITIYLYVLYQFLSFKKLIKIDNYYLFAVVLASLTSFYVHALVDFLFYVPFLLFMYSLSLGVISRLMIESDSTVLMSINKKTKCLKIIFICLIMLLIAKPAIGQIFYNKAINETNNFNIEKALSFFNYARIFNPHESRYYWYEGALLMNAVKVHAHVESAERAELLFAKGMKVSPFDSRNRLARAELHREYAPLIKKPKNLETVINWNEQVLYWKPNDPTVQSEYLKSIMAHNYFELARERLEKYIAINPQSESLQEISILLN